MKESETVGQRFIQLISHLGITKNAFAASIGKTATVIQHLVEERNKPGFDLLGSVFKIYPNVSRDWLMLGIGPMLLTDTSQPTTLTPVISSPTKAKVSAPVPDIDIVEAATNNVSIESAPAPAPDGQTASANPAVTSSQRLEAPTKTTTPETAAPVSSSAAPAAVEFQLTPTAVGPTPAVTSASAEAAWQPALYTQQMAHQLAMAELRNQHLQEQQRLMQQMLDLMQRQLSPR